MISQKDISFVRNALVSSNIMLPLELRGHYLDCFIDRVCWTYRFTNSVVWRNSAFDDISIFSIKVLVIICGALYSFLVHLIKYRKFCTKTHDSSVIAMPFCGLHVRHSRIYDLVDNVSVLYPPIFHYQYANKHIKCFHEQNKDITFGNFRFIDILSTAYVVGKNYSSLKKSTHAIDLYFNGKKGHFVNAYISSLLYKKYIDAIIKKLDAKRKKIWLFDYDFDYKYIIFNNEIKKKRNNDTTIHIQHGAFYSYVDHYCNPVSDISLCCSPREKSIIERFNKYRSIIYPLGASLQTLELNNQPQLDCCSLYDILVLLGDTTLESRASFQIHVLKELSNLKLNILIRYRPATKAIDKKYLQSVINDKQESEGKSLKQDILKSNVVISFSEDAIYECFRCNKKIVLCVEDKSCYNYNNDKSNNVSIVTVDEYNNEIVRSLLKDPCCDYSVDSFVRYNFGDYEFERIKNNLNTIIKKYS